MKNTLRTFSIYFIYLLVLTVTLISCKSDKKADANDAAEATTKDKPVHIKSERAAVLIGFWHYSMIHGDDEEKNRYTGRWIDIKRDDTFTSGLYDQQTNSGTWEFNDVGEAVILRYAKPEGLAYEWVIQGYGNTIIWKGNTGSNPKGTQIKMFKPDEPTFPEKVQ